MRAALLSLVLVGSVLPCATAADGPIAVTPEMYFSLTEISTSLISPDGKQIAFVQTRWTKGAETREAELWLVSTSNGQTQKLTTLGGLIGGKLRWSNDSKHLYFVDRRGNDDIKTAQVWRIPARVGVEPEAVTLDKKDVQGFVVSPDEKHVYYQIKAEANDPEWRTLKDLYKSGIEFGHGTSIVSEVWRVNVNGKDPERLIDGKRFIRDMELSPDGNRLALITAPDNRILTSEGQSRVEVFDIPAKKPILLPEEPYRGKAASPYGWLQYLAWSPDSKAVAFGLIFDGYPSEIMIGDLSESNPRVFKMNRSDSLSIKGYGGPIQWGSNENLFYLGEERACVRLCCTPEVRGKEQGQSRLILKGDHVVDHFSISRDGNKTAVVLNTTKHLPELFLLDGDKLRQVTDLNPQIKNWKLPQSEIVVWHGKHGDPVEGILDLPPDFDKTKKERIPLIVNIHGGPTTASYYHLTFDIYGRMTLAARGYAVLSPNYRGSTGYGDKFITDLLGKENDFDVEDILKGVDHVIQLGYADKERLGVMGWSNGGYLTNCILTKTTRFKAASSGASIVDAVMEWGTNDEPAYVMALKKGFPWTEKGEAYRKASATYALNEIKTPTLIHVGSHDERCPPGHSRMLYRALREYNKVDVELLVYKGEAHSLSKASNRRAKMEWDLAWFDRYILKK